MTRQVFLLSLCQALLTSGNILLISVTPLIGRGLAPSHQWITFPIAMQFIGLMAATIPASLIMQRVGRRRGFIMGNLIGITGAVCAIVALTSQYFWFFCFATTLIGVGIGFSTLYRFAAIEVCKPEHKSQAISLIMAGGVLAAVLGPNLSIYSQKILPQLGFTAAFVGLLALYIIALFLLWQVHIPPLSIAQRSAIQRPLGIIMRQPLFMVAALTGMVSYTVMNLLMTSTPLAMQRHGFSFPDSALVIEWHVLGMFVPSFFTGYLIRRFGATVMISSGCIMMLACVGINVHGITHAHFIIALLLLGVGWNFMFITATRLVSETYSLAEKGKTQASNEFLVFSMVTLSALASGWLESSIGWQRLNILIVPLIVLTLLGIIYHRKQLRKIDKPLN
jgi:predicted MFS family arabinose efflux permease